MKRLVPLLPLIVGAAALSWLWPSLPGRWPVHWSVLGKIDGWALKAPMSAGFLLVAGLFVAVIFEIIASTVGMARVAPAARAASELRASHQTMLRFISTIVTGFLAYVTLALPLGWGLHAILIASLLMLLATVGGISASLSKTVGKLKSQGELPAGYTAVAYCDAADSRLMVPKLSGLGYTVNLAHPMAKPLMFLLLALTLAPIALAVTVMR